jgi:hypothetical protein
MKSYTPLIIVIVIIVVIFIAALVGAFLLRNNITDDRHQVVYSPPVKSTSASYEANHHIVNNRPELALRVYVKATSTNDDYYIRIQNAEAHTNLRGENNYNQPLLSPLALFYFVRRDSGSFDAILHTIDGYGYKYNVHKLGSRLPSNFRSLVLHSSNNAVDNATGDFTTALNEVQDIALQFLPNPLHAHSMHVSTIRSLMRNLNLHLATSIRYMTLQRYSDCGMMFMLHAEGYDLSQTYTTGVQLSLILTNTKDGVYLMIPRSSNPSYTE